MLRGKNKREDFLAREYFTSKPIYSKADVFATGVLLYYMLVGEFPFKGGGFIFLIWLQDNNLDRISNIRKHEFDTSKLEALQIDPSLIEFIDKLLMKNPGKRPDFEEILQHQLMGDLNVHNLTTSTQDVKLENRLSKLIKEAKLSEVQMALHE